MHYTGESSTQLVPERDLSSFSPFQLFGPAAFRIGLPALGLEPAVDRMSICKCVTTEPPRDLLGGRSFEG